MNRYDSLEHMGTFKDYTDGTLKSVYSKKEIILETTLITDKSHRGLDVFCVPTHSYCSLGCTICHLTTKGAGKSMIPVDKRSLLEAVIRTAHVSSPPLMYYGGDLRKFEKQSDCAPVRRTKNRKALISFMGVGEPLLNLPLVFGTFDDSETIRACGYDSVGYALSTMMPNANLERVADYALKNEFPIKIHFSLHSPFTEERKKIIPNAGLDVNDALTMLCEYRERTIHASFMKDGFEKCHTTLEPIQLHYTLIDGVNDSTEHKEELIKLLGKFQIPLKILRFNPSKVFRRSPHDEAWLFDIQKALPSIRSVIYDPPGHEIGSSCGSFTRHYYLPELETEAMRAEFEEWVRIHRVE